MPRIPDDVIARLKREVSLERLVEAAGIKLTKRGDDRVGLCPFHEETEPSFVVTPSKNLFRCFGCETAGTVIDWEMERTGESFRAAVESLVAEHLPDVTLAVSAPKSEVVEPFGDEEIERWLEASDEELLSRVVGYYRERLDVDLRGREYLESRGLLDHDLVERFEIGFADRTLGLKLPVKQVKAGEAIRSRLQQLGVLRKSSGHEHLNGSVVVPIMDLEGRILQLYGRKVTKRLRKGTPAHLYLPGSRNCVFHPEALLEHEELIVAESILDALTFWVAGFPNVTCSFGTQGFTEALLESMLAHGTRRVLVAYDRDEQGERAAAELAKRLIGEGIECYRVLFPRGMDANEYAMKLGPAPRSLDLALRKAEWMGTGRAPKDRLPLSPASSPAPDAPRPPGEAAAPPAPPAAFSSAASPGASGSPAPQGSTVLAAPPAPELPVEVKEQEVVLRVGDRRYRVRGLEKNLSYDALRVNLLAARDDGFHVDTLNLYAARQRKSFIKQAAVELAIDPKLAKADLGKVLLQLEELQDRQIRAALAPEEPKVEISAADRAEAMELLEDPRLLERILEDFRFCGVVGEETNKLVVYLAAVSRKLDRPLAVMIQSSSAAGKSILMEAALAFVPEEDRVQYSAMTGQSLFYMGEKDLSHKTLAIAEEEGAGKASYALKLFQSEGRVSIASTGKDPSTGRLTTHEYEVEGPAAILTTTTAIDLDEEFQNRCLVLTVDEGREQTEQIHRSQRRGETLEGLVARQERHRVIAAHQNAQRLLEPLHVANPWADELTYPSVSTRTRRDHTKYLALIRAVALLHQHQREVRTVDVRGRSIRYVEATLDDIAVANRLAHEVLGRSLDELPPQTQNLLDRIHAMVGEACEALEMRREDYRFTRREVREYTGWGNTQLKMHIRRLEDLEYLIVHRGSRGQTYVYELLYDGQAARRERFMMGLIDVETLGGEAPPGPGRSGYDENESGSIEEKSGSEPEKSPPSRPQVAPESGGGRVEPSPLPERLVGENGQGSRETAHRAHQPMPSSYPDPRRSEGPPRTGASEEA